MVEVRNEIMGEIEMFKLDLLRFSADVNPINVTTQTGVGKDMSPTMKTFYDTALLENARNVEVFTQLGKKQPMHGNKVEWRKFNTFAQALTPLTEGVIPTGQNFGMTKIEAEITQHGDYTAISDRLEMEAYDDVIFGATEEMGATSGDTFDTLTRNILVTGTNKAYAKGNKPDDIDNTAVLTPTLVNKVYTYLKKNKAPRFDGNAYVGIVHPSQVFDLREDPNWVDAHKYQDATAIFKGEIGMLHGIRFIESPLVKITKNTSDKSVYHSLFMGKDAFGVLDVDGEGMEMIIKDKSQVGGPLNQFSTIGYKFCHGAKILYPDRIVDLMTGSSLGDDDTAN